MCHRAYPQSSRTMGPLLKKKAELEKTRHGSGTSSKAGPLPSSSIISKAKSKSIDSKKRNKMMALPSPQDALIAAEEEEIRYLERMLGFSGKEGQLGRTEMIVTTCLMHGWIVSVVCVRVDRF